MNGLSVIDAVADLVGSATLVAVTVILSDPAIVCGAVYIPVLSMVPVCGLIDQFTAVLALPATVALKSCVWLLVSETVAGSTVKETGCRVRVAVPLTAASKVLVAVTVTVWVAL